MSWTKVVYYEDPLHDDFAGTDIDTKAVPADFKFTNRRPLWHVIEFILYRLVVTPLVFIYAKLLFGLRIRGRENIRALKDTGFFLCGNHTQMSMDAFLPSLISFPHKAHIITGPDAVSIRGIRQLVLMLGAIPIPDDIKGYKNFMNTIRKRVRQGRVVAVYPEAHIWPYYTGIRPFPDTSFAYPVSEKKPVVAFVTTYRRRKILKNKPPYLTVYVSKPFYPDDTLTPKAARKKLRDEVFNWMEAQASIPENACYIRYIQK